MVSFFIPPLPPKSSLPWQPRSGPQSPYPLTEAELAHCGGLSSSMGHFPLGLSFLVCKMTEGSEQGTFPSISNSLILFWFKGERLRFPIRKKELVTQLCLTLCDPMDCSLPVPLSLEFSRQKYWSVLPFPPPADIPGPGIEPGSSALQADSLPTEPLGKPMRFPKWTLSQGLLALQLPCSPYSSSSFPPLLSSFCFPDFQIPALLGHLQPRRKRPVPVDCVWALQPSGPWRALSHSSSLSLSSLI